MDQAYHVLDSIIIFARSMSANIKVLVAEEEGLHDFSVALGEALASTGMYCLMVARRGCDALIAQAAYEARSA
jgi:hypothetical protein